jgi:hypothetical protein
VIPAELAGIGRTIADAMMFSYLGALLALSHTARKALFFDVLKASGVVGKLIIEIPHCVPRLFGNALFNFHRSLTEQILTNLVLVSKG